MRHLTILALALAAACRGQDPAPAPPPTGRTSAAPPVTAVTITEAPTASAPTDRRWDFDSDREAAPPVGFSFARTGEGREGKWSVVAETGAPSGKNVLAQTDADTTDSRFPIAIADAPSLEDVDLAVRCKPVSGKVDRACGLVFRYKDAKNYYVTRANALEDNVRLYYVKDGRREQIASYGGKVAPGTWHTYRVVATRDHLEVWWDGSKVLDAKDSTFAGAGRVGVWTKADSVTYFDDLTVRAPR